VGTTLFMTVLSGWMGVLGRLARQEDVVVGTPVANRGHAQVEGLIGFFVNALALRVEVRGGLTVRELLERVKGSALEAQQHQDIPFEQVVERVKPERSLAHSPIFQAAFGWQNNNEGRTPTLPGVEVRTLESAAHVVSKFDLTLFMREKGEGIAAVLEYATSLFDQATVRRMCGYLRAMLAGMVEDEKREIGAIGLLTAEERRQVLEEWNDTGREVTEGTLPEIFERQVERTPEAVAVVYGEQSVSYRELEERANKLAHYLRGQGVGPESRVAIGLERGIDMVVCQLATLKAGGGYLPLDLACPMARLKVMVEDARPVLLLARGGGEERWAALGVDLSVIDLDQPEKPWERMPSIALESRGSRESLAYIIYTSGSTGEPRGVMVEQGAVADLVLNTDYVQLGPSDVVGHVSNTAFDAATWEMWGALLTGARLVCIEREEALSPQRLGKVLESAGVTALFLTTALFNQVASEAPESFAGLDHLLFGGERVDPELERDVLLRGRPGRLLHL
jgi:non-ribosomal peptide synthetase component F